MTTLKDLSLVDGLRERVWKMRDELEEVNIDLHDLYEEGYITLAEYREFRELIKEIQG